MIRLVLDTNILVSANINEEGIEALVVSFGVERKGPTMCIRTDSQGIPSGRRSNAQRQRRVPLRPPVLHPLPLPTARPTLQRAALPLRAHPPRPQIYRVTD